MYLGTFFFYLYYPILLTGLVVVVGVAVAVAVA